MALQDPTHYQLIYAAVRQVPKGNVATYGQIAELAGLPHHARQVGYALHALPENSTVPWHRIINAQGKISLDADAALRQRMKLQREGVVINERGVIDLKQYRWIG